MSLSRKSIETMIDLVEIRISCMETIDNNDNRAVKRLEQCRSELYDLTGQTPRSEVIPMGDPAVA
jgi:hypothetical protein